MTTHSASPCRVLVVDDEALIRWSIQQVLSDRGYVVVEAAMASEALTLASGLDQFDVILLDLHLPDSTDLRLLEKLHALSPTARIIMMTAYATPEIADISTKLGAERCIGKPFRLDDLAAFVAAA